MHQHILLLIATAMAATIVLIVIPPLVRVVKAKHLFEPKDHRKLHGDSIPSIGGVAIFLAFVISTYATAFHEGIEEFAYLTPAMILMFFVGLKDDLITISPRKKFMVQIAAALMLTLKGNIHLHYLNGFLGIYELNYWILVPFSVILIIAAINALNLIDGIDGLASGLTALASILLGVGFIMIGHLEFAVMAFALTGSVLAFFYFNVFGTKYKFFMGDTGSLIIGTAIIAMVFKFVEHSAHVENYIFKDYAIALVSAVLVVPVVDLIRVMAIRMSDGKSPFYPDRRHIHHNVLDISSSHLSATVKILTANVFFVALTLVLIILKVNINAIMITIYSLGFFMAWVPYRVKQRAKTRDRKGLSLGAEI